MLQVPFQRSLFKLGKRKYVLQSADSFKGELWLLQEQVFSFIKVLGLFFLLRFLLGWRGSFIV